MAYIQTAYATILDTSTFSFTSLQEVSKIGKQKVLVPQHLYPFQDKERLIRDTSTLLSRAEEFDLNNLHLYLYVMPNFSETYGTVVFPDKRTGKQLEYKMHNKAIYDGMDDVAYLDIDGTFAGERVRERIDLDEPPWGYPRYKQSKSHFSLRMKYAEDTVFNFGLTQDQYGVVYRGKQLEGTTYVLFMHAWAILLTDDMQFDSLVVLNGVKGGKLSVERFLYTVNPYIVKTMTLVR